MNFKIVFNILFLIEFISANLSAQGLKFEYITPDDGLSQSSITSIIEDKYGFMWFGTMNGLNRYDGYTFVKYFTNVKDSTSIAGNLIGPIYEDKQGNIWIGTDNGLSLYNRDKDNFTNFRHKDDDPNTISGLVVSCFLEDSKSQFWVGTNGGGLNLFDRGSKIFLHYLHSDNDPNSLCSNSVNTIVEDNDGRIWIGTYQGGLSLFNRTTNTFVNFRQDVNNPESLASNTIYAFAKDSSGIIWMGTPGNGICRINVNHNGGYSFSTFKPHSHDIRRFKVLSLFLDKSDRLWIGTENGGLDCFEIKNKTFTNYHVDENDPNSLNNNSIHAICKDKTGNLWVGTYTGGVNVVKKNKKKIDTYRKMQGNTNGLSYNAVTCFYDDRKDGNFWIGTDGGGVNCWNRNTNETKHFNSKNSSLKSDAVLAICKDHDNDIWIGGWECGLNLYNREKHTFTNFSKAKDGIPSNNIFDMLVDRKGRIWISFGGIGFARYDKKLNTCKLYTIENSILPSQWILSIKEDFSSNILLGHAHGFSIFNPEKGSFENYSHNDKDSSSLCENQVNTIMVASDSAIWIGTVNGLNRFNPVNKKFTAFYVQDGLTNNNVVGLAEDAHNHIWISTVSGISDFNLKTGKFKNYNLSDGIQGKNFIRNSSYCTSKGEMAFGGTNGFNIIQPDSLFDNPHIPPIFITDFTIFNKSVKVGEAGSPLSQNISQTHQITLSYIQSVFSFEFVALDYTSPDQNQYAYMMEGFEKEWNYVGSKRAATYTNLDPGNYVFRVKGSNNDGKWNEEGVSLHIIITPPFWKTWWFRTIFGILVLAGIFETHQWRVKQLRAREKKLNQRVDERTKELQLRTDELQEEKEALNESEERFRIIAEQTGRLVFDCRLETGIIKWAGAIQEVTGYTPDEHRNSTIFDWRNNIHPEDRERAVSLIEEANRTTGHYLIEYRYRRRDGEYIHIEEQGVSLKNESGKVERVLGAIANITERKIGTALERERLITELQNAAADIKVLSGLVPICSICKKIRDDKGYWTKLEGYIQAHSQAKFSHGVCPDCMKKLNLNIVPKKTE